jgi:hypothetical protein
MYLGDNLISWSSRRQTTVSRSSVEAEYHNVATAIAESCWVQQLMQELLRPTETSTIVYCDNVVVAYLSANLGHHRRTKHIELGIHFVREKVALVPAHVLHVPSILEYVDIFTKGLPKVLFREFRSSLLVDALASSECGRVSEGGGWPSCWSTLQRHLAKHAFYTCNV